MLWFLRGIGKGVVTTRYPDRPEPSSAQLPTPPAFRVDVLTVELADRLAAACPAGALRRDSGDLVLDLGSCTACGCCSEVGGDAVVPSGEFELASRDRDALLKRIPIGASR
jgi:formate hydrogenlyase subunit 6/NADH:ubiquinone oxidoreductase subunit I